MKNSEITTKIETITPEIATEYLKSNQRNRMLRQSLVNQYASDMKAGNWRLTPQGIIFDTEGTLSDGQHRLHAVVLAGVSVEMFVFRQMPTRDREALDIGGRRSPNDILEFRGHSYPIEKASIAKRIMIIRSGTKQITSHASGGGVPGSSKSRFTNIQIADFYEENSNLIDELFAFSNHLYHSTKFRLITATDIAGLLYEMGSSTDARQFISDVFTGQNLKKDTSAYLLRNRLILSKSGANRLTGKELRDLWIKAYERRGATLKILKV